MTHINHSTLQLKSGEHKALIEVVDSDALQVGGTLSLGKLVVM